MNKKSLSFIAIVLISASFFQAMDENTNSSNLASLKSAFKTPGSPKKTSSPFFKNTAFVVLIPHVEEYHKANIAKRIWYTTEETEAIKNHVKLLKSISDERIDNLAISNDEKELIKKEKKIVIGLNAQKKSHEEKAAHIENVFRQIEEQEYQNRKKLQKEDAKNIVQRFLGIQF